MIQFRTKTVKGILDPVLQQIESLVMIGELIEKGNKIPNLEKNILNIACSTSNLVQVINKTLSTSNDKKLVEDLKEFTAVIQDNVQKLENSAKLYENGNYKEGSSSLIVGANGVINNVIKVLNSHDDSQIRKIENHLQLTRIELEKIVPWTYDSLVDIIETIQKELAYSLRFLNQRIPEIISIQLSEKIKLCCEDLQEYLEKYINNLNAIFENKGPNEHKIAVEKSSRHKFQIYKTVIYLIVLIWLNDLDMGEIEIFVKSLKYFREFSTIWLKNKTEQVSDDNSGLLVIDYLLNGFENYVVQKNFSCKEILEDVHEIKNKIEKISDELSTGSLLSKNENLELNEKLEKIQKKFLACFDNWIILFKKTNKTNMLSSDQSFSKSEDWISNLKSIYDIALTLCESPSDLEADAETRQILSDIFKAINDKNLYRDFDSKSQRYNDINKSVNKLLSLTQQLGYDKNLNALLAVKKSCINLQNDVKNIETNYNSDNIAKAELDFSNLDQNIEKLKTLTHFTINSHPMPLNTVHQIEKSLEKIYTNKNFINKMLGELKKSPSDPEILKTINDLIAETNEETKRIEDMVVENLNPENLIRYAQSICQKDENLNGIKCKNQKEQLQRILDIIEKKIENDIHDCQDEGTKNVLKQNLENVKKAKEECLKGQNPLKHLKNIVNPEHLHEINMQLNDVKVSGGEVKEEEVPPAYVVPEKYIKANIVIQNPDINDRLAVAAKELHNQVKLDRVKDSSIAQHALDISYMFADFSSLFRENKDHSQMIETAKNISKDTLFIVKLVKELMARCRDNRLKQILSSECEKLPTICNQLKILSTLTASRLKANPNISEKSKQDSNELLFECAENLMRSLKDVVKAAEAAEIKSAPRKKITTSEV